MRKAMAAGLVTVMMTAAVPTTASAEGKDVAGAWLVLGGAGAVAAAFNYGEKCPSGYRKYTFEDLPTACVYTDRFGGDIRDATGTMSLQRPALLWGGLAAAGTGAILMLLPDSAAKFAPNVSITPNGVSASKTVSFGK
jgi:hypothetical protein